MPWTEEQSTEVFEQFWLHGGARCPVDNSILDVRKTDFIGGQYIVMAHCPRCGSDMQMGREQDPRRGDFRQWTDEEKAALIDAHFQRQYATCPVCDAAVQMQSAPTFGANHVLIRCVRCGNSHQESFSHR